MKVLFVCGLYPKGTEAYYTSVLKHGSLANPSNVYQWGVVEGLLANNIDLEVCSFPFLPTCFSGNSKTSTREEAIEYQNRVIGCAYSYSTFPVLKELTIMRKLRMVVRRWSASIAKDEKGVILIYSLYGPFLKASIARTKENPKIMVCPIVTDLFISSLKVLRKYPLLKKIQGYFEYKMIKYGLDNAHTFVLLAKGMEKYVPRAINNHVIVEGIAGAEYPKPVSKESTTEKILLYTGSLDMHTSVKELVDAFMLTSDSNFRLVICGAGAYEKYILEKSQQDKRIIYKGPVLREEAVRLQRSATLLINPRLSSIPDTPYSFPSKTIEYLASGTPMIGYKLVGITEDYYSYFYIPVDESIDALSHTISDTLNRPQTELDKRALDAWKFINTQKTADRQIKKMIDHFKGYINENSKKNDVPYISKRKI